MEGLFLRAKAGTAEADVNSATTIRRSLKDLVFVASLPLHIREPSSLQWNGDLQQSFKLPQTPAKRGDKHWPLALKRFA